MDRRPHAHQRVGAQAVLADDDDVADRAASGCGGARGGAGAGGGRGGRGGRGQVGARPPAAPAAGAGGCCGRQARGCRRSTSAQRATVVARRGASTPRLGQTTLARFSICLNLAPSERFVRRPPHQWPARATPRRALVLCGACSLPAGCVRPRRAVALRVGQGLQARPAVRRRTLPVAGRRGAGASPPARTAAGRRRPRRCPQYAIEPAQAMFRSAPPTAGARRSCFPRSSRRSGGRSPPAARSCRRRPSPPTVGAGRVAGRQAVRRSRATAR